jgi:hypothetical protein
MPNRIQGGTHPVSGIEQDFAYGMPDQEERHRHGNRLAAAGAEDKLPPG